MLRFRMHTRENGDQFCGTNATGQEVLRHPMLNKGTAFPREERAAFNIDVWLPPAVSPLELQLERCFEAYNAFIFPGVGLGAIAVRARAVSDEMFTAAAARPAELVPEDRIARQPRYSRLVPGAGC